MANYGSTYEGLRLVNHGGQCCGIKTIFGFMDFDVAHQFMCDSLPLVTKDNSDINYDVVTSDKRFFTDSAPKENYFERLERYIAFVAERRNNHLIEVTLNAGRDSPVYNHQREWLLHLEGLNFKEVNRFYNGNSGNFVAIMHLVLKG